MITFNYDILTELALIDEKMSYDYGLPTSRETIAPFHIPLLKLHGSLNWMSCPKCNQVVPIDILDTISKQAWYSSNGLTTIAISSEGNGIRHECGTNFISPVIVPPTWNKTEYANSLASVWKEAARQLSDAENIFVSGYSLPETDMFFKHLFALGAVGNNLINRFWVFDPDRDGSVENRFRALLGKAVAGRFKMFNHTNPSGHGGFRGLVDRLVGLHASD